MKRKKGDKGEERRFKCRKESKRKKRKKGDYEGERRLRGRKEIKGKKGD